MSTALYRRYRPETFADVIGQEHVTDPLRAALRSDRITHAYLFSGPRGCGKTTSARIFARCLNCAEGPTDTPCGTCPSCVELARDGAGSLDVVEMDAASHGGVEDARELRERAAFAPARDRYKIFIIDEAHMVTSQGFNALLKLVEEPPAHVKFVFATTEPEKVIGTIRSRTHHYPFRLVPPERLQAYLEELCVAEDVSVETGVLPLVVRAGGGSVRDSLSVLDQLIAGAQDGEVSYERAVALLGYTHATLLDDVVDALAARDGASLFRVVDRVIDSGHDPRRFAEDLLERIRDLVVIAVSREHAATVLRSLPKDQFERMRVQSQQLGPAELSRAGDLVNDALTEMSGATSPRLQLELMCARLLLPGADDAARGHAARLDRIERHLSGSAPAGAAGAGDAAPAAVVPPAAAGGVPTASEQSPSSSAPVGGTPQRGGRDARPESGGTGGSAQADAGAGAEGEAAVQRTSEPPVRAGAGARAEGQPVQRTSEQPAPRSGTDGTGERTAVQSAPSTAESAEGDRSAGDPGDGSADAGHAAGRPAEHPTEARPANTAADGPAQHGHRARAADVPSPTRPLERPAATDDRSAGQGAAVAPAQQDVSWSSVADGPMRPGTPSSPAASPARPAAPAPQPASADADLIRRRWSEVLATLARFKRATWALVDQNAQVGEVSGGVLHLAFATSGLAHTFRNGAHADALQRALLETLGVELRIEPVLSQAAEGGRQGGTSPYATAQTPADSWGGPPDAGFPADPGASPGATAWSTGAGQSSGPHGTAGGSPGAGAGGSAWLTRSAPPPAEPDPSGPGERPSQKSSARRGDADGSGRRLGADGPTGAAPSSGTPPTAGTPPEAPVARVAPADDTPSRDDPDAEHSGMVGAPLIERMLGGTIISEE